MGNKFGWHSGVLTCKDAKIQGDLYVQDDIVFSDVSAGRLGVTGGIDLSGTSSGSANIILGGNGRISTGTDASTSLGIDATNDQYGEGLELRYHISDWADTYTITTGTGMYLRMENREANASGSIYGSQIWGVANNVNTQYVWGGLFYAYIKGTSAKTLTGIYAIQPEISFDAGSSTNTITDAAVVRAKVTGGVMSDYTVLDGFRLTLGDMDGGSRTYGNGLLLEDDSDMSGTSVLTTGVNINIACTTAISVSGANERILDFGSATSGTTTDGVIMRVGTGIGTSGMALATDGMRGFALYLRNTGATTGITGMRLRGIADPTSGSASIDTLLVQTSCIASKNAATLNTAFFELIPKGTNTITTGRVLLCNADSAASQTMTTQIIGHFRVHTRGDESITTDEMLRLENEAVGGNGRQLDSFINVRGTTLSGGIKAAGYLIDGGTSTDLLGTAFVRLPDDGTIVSVTNGSILNDISATANAGFIKVLIGANTRYIAVYEAKA
ncbi:MAG: hypothetical protein ACFFG0_03060 [Candidatus Thorarchaeota archaeon]